MSDPTPDEFQRVARMLSDIQIEELRQQGGRR
jgi:hypothetical protein